MEVPSPFGRARASGGVGEEQVRLPGNPLFFLQLPKALSGHHIGPRRGESPGWDCSCGLGLHRLSDLPQSADPSFPGFQQKYWDLDIPRYFEGFEFDIFPLSWANTQGHFSIEGLWAFSFYLWLKIRSDLKVP